MGRSEKIARLHVHHYQELDFLERINPHERPALHRLSEKGSAVMGGPSQYVGSSIRRDSIVEQAMRTQPNSIFEMCAKL